MGLPIRSQPGDMVCNCKLINYLPSKKGARMAVFECKCGKLFEAAVKCVRKFNVRGCKECGIAGKAAVGKLRFLPTHGMSHLPEYDVWLGIKKRCSNKTGQNYKYYGGRGITVCDRWLEGFENFYADMGPRPSAKYSIERKNVNLGYEPVNCIWLLTKLQGLNKRNNLVLEYNGERKTITEWAREKGFREGLINERLQKLGWDLGRALNTPPDTRPRKNRQPGIKYAFGFINA